MPEPLTHPAHGWTPGTGFMLAELARQTRGGSITLERIVERFQHRAHGLVLLLVLLPVFIPLPLGTGLVAGALACLIGAQLLAGRTRPWLPQRILRREIKASSLAQFNRRMQRPLYWLEHICRPRLPALLTPLPASIVSGLQLIGLGILLALPIPFTNWFYGLLLMLHAIALIERDGVLMLIAWVLGTAAMLASVLLSNELFGLLQLGFSN